MKTIIIFKSRFSILEISLRKGKTIHDIGKRPCRFIRLSVNFKKPLISFFSFTVKPLYQNKMFSASHDTCALTGRECDPAD
ncbi:MAG: hypothetical protein AB7F64_01315 [Gammaproteobacteria bacterium]